MKLNTERVIKRLFKFIRINFCKEKTNNLKTLLNDPRMDPVLKEMILIHESNQKKITISNYWQKLNQKNISQLLEHGFENFKQTVALNYFTWLLQNNDSQVKFLKKNLPKHTINWAKKLAQKSPKHLLFSPKQSEFYNLFTLMLWKYTKNEVNKNILKKLEEPSVGNPPAINIDGKWISQDLANSVLEYQSILSGFKNFKKINTILEVGAGYGRTAYVLLTLNHRTRYIIADIPPALYISQRYLSLAFPNRKIFKFRDFGTFAEVKKDFFSSKIIFLMPFQLKKIPANTFDLCLAIDCLHEMLPKEIDSLFVTINRLARNFYFKCWKKTTIPYDGITLTEKDYPIRPHWKKVFWRECKVQTDYFETLFSIKKRKYD